MTIQELVDKIKAAKTRSNEMYENVMRKIAMSDVEVVVYSSPYTKEEEKQIMESLERVNEEMFSIDLDDEKDREKLTGSLRP